MSTNTHQKYYVKHANSKKLKRIFEKYASIERNGEKFMTPDDFIRQYLGMYTNDDFNKETIEILASLADRKRKGEISYQQFEDFERILCLPDAIFQVVFMLFDANADNVITFTEFVETLRKTELFIKEPLNTDSRFMNRHFGKNRDKSISYSEFSQVLPDFHHEHAVECFVNADKDSTGVISVDDFEDIMVNDRKHLLTCTVKSSLSRMGSQMSFPVFLAFNSILHKKQILKRIYLNASNGSRSAEVTKQQFIQAAQAMSQMSLLEVHILYELLKPKEALALRDINDIAPEHYSDLITTGRRPAEGRGVLLVVLESLYRFVLGFFAGGVGAAAVFPIDLIKTRMQNQRKTSAGTSALYKGYIDCLFRVIKNEGFIGLYRGLLPLLVLVSPEKAVKLTTNDFVRDLFYDEDGNIPFPAEAFAGSCAGIAQDIFTNPLEIVKIRMQVAGETGSKAKAWHVVKELGPLGLYKGLQSCILRDIIFSGIYFPSYAHTKDFLADENGYNSPWTLLAAGGIAGIPAAFLATPADVIKTRIQVKALPGQTTYTGVMDASKKIMAEEGFKAFWTGALVRILRSSPQFAVTLLTYEILHRLIYIDFSGTRPKGSECVAPPIAGTPATKKLNPDHIGGYSVARPIFMGIETKFGICLPQFRTATD